MILQSYITQWQAHAPWPYLDQVEHDLVLSRAICELYKAPVVASNLIFRGGTALHKLFFDRPGRFSEDLDFVQREAQPIGDTITAVRSCLDHWLGQPKWKQGESRFTLYYRFETETEPVTQRKLKVEINTREHFNILPLKSVNFSVSSDWYKGCVGVSCYELEELLATKLRALYQRSKGRDLFDVWYACQKFPSLNLDKVVDVFANYMDRNQISITAKQYLENLQKKKTSQVFNDDIHLLLSPDVVDSYTQSEAYDLLFDKVITRMRFT